MMMDGMGWDGMGWDGMMTASAALLSLFLVLALSSSLRVTLPPNTRASPFPLSSFRRPEREIVADLKRARAGIP